MWSTLAVVMLLASPTLAWCLEEEVLVRVRAVRASEGVLSSHEKADIHCDPRLEDLRGKLSRLDFRRYKLLSEQKALIPIKKKETIALIEGQTLTVRPLYVENEKVGLWLKWKDASGMEILDTRLHFQGDQSMLTGTDGESEESPSAGIILAIDVQPGQAK